ncbi:MAG TPA: FHA domain-containing protein [Vicinamibacteria bacterium]|nr:FHA domain-containing protein [Vicinamibacteria bacterium]
MKLRFGDCVFDADARRLERSGKPIELTPKAFALLELLVRERPRAVSKAEIRDALWPETFVSDVNLATLAFEVRQGIGDDARAPRWLRTVRGFGYAFEAEAEPGASSPFRVFLIWKEREFALGAGVHDIGRAEEADVVLAGAKVSRLHARIRVEGRSASIEDLASKNGTFLRETRLAGSVTLSDGDVIRLGTESLTVRFAAPDSPTETLD